MKGSVFAVALGMCAVCASLSSSNAFAQEYMPATSAYLASGVESSGSGLQRARTRLRMAFELRIDEAPEDAIVGAALADLEPKTAFGAELCYLRTLGTKIAVSGGAIGYFVPMTLLGPTAKLEVRIPVARKSYLAVGPDVAIFPLGSDVPDRTVIWQALFQAGFRADL